MSSRGGCTQRRLPRVSCRGLRHSFATFSLQTGIDLKHTAAALGHSGAGITGRIYAHLTEVVQEEAAARLDNLLGRRPAANRTQT